MQQNKWQKDYYMGQMMNTKKLTEINILGTIYKISYYDNSTDVDIHKREPHWGQIDYWTRTIRLYKNDFPDSEIFKTLFHEMLHGIMEHGQMQEINTEKNVELLTNLIVDTLLRNNLITIKEGVYEN